jgi:CubicO group peptidase (beta-lactamase class C family)
VRWRGATWRAIVRTSTPSLRAQRHQLVSEYLSLPPDSERGSFACFGLGYVVAGAMLEASADESWEKLLRRLVFAPLALARAGFGAPGTAGRRDQPWGHLPVSGGFLPLEPRVDADIPLAVGPAGTVHAPLCELVRYYPMHLDPGSVAPSRCPLNPRRGVTRPPGRPDPRIGGVWRPQMEHSPTGEVMAPRTRWRVSNRRTPSESWW